MAILGVIATVVGLYQLIHMEIRYRAGFGDAGARKLRRLHEEELFRQRKNGLEPPHASALVAALRSALADRIRHNAS